VAQEAEADSEAASDPVVEELRRWYWVLRSAHKTHYERAARLTWRDRGIGYSLVILTAVSGITAFATVGVDSILVQLSVGALGAVSAILASIQVFGRAEGEIARHRETARRYGELRRELGMALARSKEGEEVPRELVERISRAWAELDQVGEPLPRRLFLKHVRAGTKGPYES
jgi:hypothetical protein